MTAVAPTTDRAAIRRLILILSACGFASGLTTRFVDPMVGVIARDLGADPLSVALLSSAFALPYALIQPILGPVGDALGKERIIKILLAALAITVGGAALTTDLTLLFIFRVLSGAAGGGIIPMSLATIADRVAMGERQVAIGRFLAAAITGHLLGGVGSGLLAEYVGWRGVFGLASALSAISCLAVSLGFRGRTAATGVLSLATALARYRQIIGIGRARALMGFVFAEGVLIFGLPPYIAPLLEHDGLGGATEAGLILGAFAIGGIVYTILVRWLLATLGLGRMLILGGAFAALAFGALSAAIPWRFEAAALFFMGIGFYMLHNSFQTQMTEVVPDARGSAVAMHAFSFFIGQALGPVVFGFLLASVGRAGATSICAAGLLAMGFVAAATFGERAPKPG